MKLSQTTSVIAISALLATAGVAAADSINSAFEGSVSVLSPDQTGFIIGGQVSVNGLGSAALTMSRNVANLAVVGSAEAEDNRYIGEFFNVLDGANANSGVMSTLSFDREISTSGSLVGQGAVVSRGEAIAALGSAGAASASAEIAGVSAGGEGSATAESNSQGSLNGSLSTSNSLQLLGTSGLFAASNGLTVGEDNFALAYGSSDVNSDPDLEGVDLNDFAGGYNLEDLDLTGYNGALFVVESDLTNANDEIEMSVSNAGNGTVSITTSTGGFFTGGAAAGGASTFVNNGSFFRNID